MKVSSLFTLLCLCIVSVSNAQSWVNPVTLEGEWSSYGIGDPYILKHRGLYYLYCSTKDAETGVKCWSSKDLINWTNEGLCSTDQITKGAYAPEVIYWDGQFYMYTSPAGNGHYVLSSTEPTGPFTAITGNYGKWIDGSVYIDDDAKLYFYNASPSGILGCTMSNPYTFGESINLNAQMNNTWTEGPCVFKRNGKYYMIYTGNHLISKGYRIDYASNSTGPIDSYNPAENQNPILINTMGDHVGLGHGTIFVGPDLDSYYLTYHNLVSPHGPRRKLNFDRIAWNGDKMMLLGATEFEQQAMALSDAYDYFDRTEIGDQWSFPSGGRWNIKNGEYLSQDTVMTVGDNWFMALLTVDNSNEYTAEYNFKETYREDNSSQLGIVFDYADENNYGVALINSNTNQMEIKILSGGLWSASEFIDLPGNQDFSKWHSARIEKFDASYKFFLDNMHLHTASYTMEPGSIGYVTNQCKADFSFIAFSKKVNGSGIFDVYKPIPGTIDAVLFNSGGEGTGFHEETEGSHPDILFRHDENEITESPDGGYAISTFEANDWYKYNVNVKNQGLYNCAIIYASESPGAKIQLSLDDELISEPIELSTTGGLNTYRTILVKDLSLEAAYHTLKIESISGSINLYSMTFVTADNDPFYRAIDFTGAFGMGWEYYDGNWSIQDNTAQILGYGKRTFGSSLWTDYTVLADIRFTRSMNAGIVFRVNNPALGGAGNDPAAGTDFLQGYFAGFNYSSIVLGKHNYNWKQLATASGSYAMNTWYRMKIKVSGNNIKVYVDDMHNPMIDHTDPNPFINGMAGIRSFNSDVQFDHFRVTNDTTFTDIANLEPAEKNFQIYPNPAADYIHVDLNVEGDRELRILNLKGEELLYRKLHKKQELIPLRTLVPGMYIVRILDKKRVLSEKLIIQ